MVMITMAMIMMMMMMGMGITEEDGEEYEMYEKVCSRHFVRYILLFAIIVIKFMLVDDRAHFVS